MLNCSSAIWSEMYKIKCSLSPNLGNPPGKPSITEEF